MPDPAIGRIVWYRTKVGEYDLPAMITATQETLHAEGVALYLESRKTVPVAMGSTVALDALSPVPGSQPVPVEPEPGSWRWPVIR
jgi:hypothetical protein